MAVLKFETKIKTDLKGKPRVYFTCHPDDFSLYFPQIREDIFRTHDCTIYYTENMHQPIDEDDKEVDLGQMNLFVVPVTLKLLNTANRAMDSDIAYAKEKKIPILPFIMEQNKETKSFYAVPNKFGSMQYLDPYSQDVTAISYHDKLKKYLDSVLISDEMVRRIRAAFDAYVFLSYRKKDRRYANQLMKLIHSVPGCCDIAIWYDEFLTPGESFQKNITRALKESKLFTLLVTPNLLEEPGGKPNFVMGNEYPAAYEAKMDILPIEMEPTDSKILREKYKGIPICLNPDDDEFIKRLVNSLAKVAIADNDDCPEHNFLVGLAYIDGIDVEVDIERGMKLITSAAEANLPEAMEKLCDIYEKRFVFYERMDFLLEAEKWANRLVEYYKLANGEESLYTLHAMNKLADIYFNTGRTERSEELLAMLEKIYSIRCKLLGEIHPDTLDTLNNLALAYSETESPKKGLDLCYEVYKKRCEVLGEIHSDTLITLHNIARINQKRFCNFEDACLIMQKLYGIRQSVYGESHMDTIISLMDLALLYGLLHKNEKMLESYLKSYEILLGNYGESHPITQRALGGCANAYLRLENYDQALFLQKQQYEMYCKYYGKKSYYSIKSLSRLARVYMLLGDLDVAKKAFYEVSVYQYQFFGSRRDVFGAERGLEQIMTIESGEK